MTGSRTVVAIAGGLAALSLVISFAFSSAIRDIGRALEPNRSLSSESLLSLFAAGSEEPGAPPAAPSDIAGDMLDCPPAGAGPEDRQARFHSAGTGFELVGKVVSFDAVTLEVDSPAGRTQANLAVDVELSGHIAAEAIVSVRGTRGQDGRLSVSQVRSVCQGQGVVRCAVGYQPQFALKAAAGSFSVLGLLDSLSSDAAQVAGPGVLVQAVVDPDTNVQPGLKPGDAVTANGTITEDGRFRLAELRLLCPLVPPSGPATPGASPAPTPAPPPVFPPPHGGGGGHGNGHGRGRGPGRGPGGH